jgi:hypothetical protein
MNALILHGCSSREEYFNDKYPSGSNFHWIPWLQKQLLIRNIPTQTPEMPASYAPVYEDWKKTFERFEIGPETVLVGHSCGCAFLVRWLGDSKRKIDKLILVAPWKIARKGNKEKEVFYEYPIDETIKSRVNKIVMFTADNEAKGGKESLRMFHDALDGKVIKLKGKGHYTQDEMGTDEFPELLAEVLN